jgi:diguanylate cyclase (GGDEF)-like protein
MRIKDLPGPAWQRVLSITIAVTLASAALSALLTWLILTVFANGVNQAGLAVAIGLPLFLGGPLTLVHVLRLTQLRLANQQLQVLASTDGLTACLNRRAFTSEVAKRLRRPGAFLVIDADNFKVINDRYGHDRGDEALKLLAATIKANVRADDIVGRIGGEEFGVLLHEASLETARMVAERIRTAVEAIGFAPDGCLLPLSVSVGGAFFERDISFSELFRIADQRLYRVKQNGRNRVDITLAPGRPQLGKALSAA